MFVTSAVLAIALTIPAQHSSVGRAAAGHNNTNTTSRSGSTVKGHNYMPTSAYAYGYTPLLYGNGYGSYGYNPYGYGSYGYNPYGYGSYGYGSYGYGYAMGYPYLVKPLRWRHGEPQRHGGQSWRASVRHTGGRRGQTKGDRSH
jgi:hypothetical protein